MLIAGDCWFIERVTSSQPFTNKIENRKIHKIHTITSMIAANFFGNLSVMMPIPICAPYWNENAAPKNVSQIIKYLANSSVHGKELWRKVLETTCKKMMTTITIKKMQVNHSVLRLIVCKAFVHMETPLQSGK